MTHDSAEDRQHREADERPPLVHIAFPEKVTAFVWLAMIVGILLVATCISCNAIGLDLEERGSVVISAGIAIILAAFGGQATIYGKAYVLAGVAALAFILIVGLEHQRGLDLDRRSAYTIARAKDYAKGFVHGVPRPPVKVSLTFGPTVLESSYISSPDLFSFVVLGEQTDEAAVASLTFEPPDEQISPLITIGIDVSCIKIGLGATKALDWAVVHAGPDWKIIDKRVNKVIGQFGQPVPPSCHGPYAASKGAPHSSIADTIFGGWSAFAGDTPLTPQPAATDGASAQIDEPPAILLAPNIDVNQVGGDLSSGEPEIRSSARKLLSVATPDQVPMVLNLLTKDSPFRTKLGVAVGLTEMVRRDRSQNATIAANLTEQNRRALLDLAADPDPTIGTYATEFLYNLDDPAITKLAVSQSVDAPSDKERYTWLSVAQDGWPRLSRTDKEGLMGAVNETYSKSDERTKALLDTFQQ